MRVAGSGSTSVEISPTDVESPMCTTDVHDVRSPAAGAVVPATTAVGGDDELATSTGATAVDVVEPSGVASADEDREASTQAPTIASTTTSTAGMASARGSVTGGGRYRRAANEGGARRGRRTVRSSHQARRGSQ